MEDDGKLEVYTEVTVLNTFSLDHWPISSNLICLWGDGNLARDLYSCI